MSENLTEMASPTKPSQTTPTKATTNNKSPSTQKANDDKSNDHSASTNNNNNSDSNDLSAKNELKFRENLYRLIISQLFYDGHQNIAVGLSGLIQVAALNLYRINERFINLKHFSGNTTLSSLKSFVKLGQTSYTE